MTVIERIYQAALGLLLTAGLLVSAAIITGALPYRQRTVWELRQVECATPVAEEQAAIECSQNRQTFEPVYVPWAVWR